MAPGQGPGKGPTTIPTVQEVKQYLNNPLKRQYSVWKQELKNDVDCEFLLNGINSGFRVTDPGAILAQVHCKNNKSALSPKTISMVEKQIYEEINDGAYVCVADKPTIISPLGCIAKKGSQDIRLIHDCSQPFGRNLNSYASKNKFQYETIDHATELIPTNGYCSKIDLRHAYRVVGLHPDSIDAAGLEWTFTGAESPSFLVDTRLMFGASKAPEIFQRLSNSVVRMMKRRGFTVLAYLDDFLVIADSYVSCLKAHNSLLSLLQNLGFINQHEKSYSALPKINIPWY